MNIKLSNASLPIRKTPQSKKENLNEYEMLGWKGLNNSKVHYTDTLQRKLPKPKSTEFFLINTLELQSML